MTQLSSSERTRLIGWTSRLRVMSPGDQFHHEKAMTPQAVIWLKRGDTWEMSSIFQGVFRAARQFATERFDKPAALVYAESEGWEVEFRDVAP